VVPTVVVDEEEDSSVEVLASMKKMMGDQAEGIGAEPIPEAAELKWKSQAVGTGEFVHKEDRSGKEPDLMEVDQAVRIGDAPVRENMEERTGAEPVPEDVAEETGAIPVREAGEGDLHFEDYPGDDFENVGKYTPEETSQTPLPAPEHPAETPSSAELRRMRFKTLVGGRSFHGSGSLQFSKPKPLHLPSEHLKNSLPNQPANHTD